MRCFCVQLKHYAGGDKDSEEYYYYRFRLFYRKVIKSTFIPDKFFFVSNVSINYI